MGIDIKINIDLSPRQKKVVRAAVVTGAVIGALGIGIAIAAPIDTTWVVTGAPLTAVQLKGSLDGLQAQVTALQAFQMQATANGSYSLGATYCGATAATEGAFSGPGSLTGYASAKAQCQGVSGCSPAAGHMCTNEEIVRSMQVGVAVGASGWISTGTAAQYTSTGRVMDCESWRGVSSTVDLGALWSPGSIGPQPNFDWCNNPHAILCCD
jgi:hypothetical protein